MFECVYLPWVGGVNAIKTNTSAKGHLAEPAMLIEFLIYAVWRMLLQVPESYGKVKGPDPSQIPDRSQLDPDP